MKKGFTLVELLVVVLIIGIISAYAIPQYGRSVRRAEMIEGLTHGKTIYESALRYKSVNGVAPSQFNQIDIGFPGAQTDSASFADGNFTYTLGNEFITITNNVSGYKLLMQFPIISSTGVLQPIYCCADGADKDGVWLCKNAGEGITNGCK